MQTVARILKQNLKRPGDLAARWGGEEFSVLLPMTDMSGAMIIAENIRAEIESTTIPCNNGASTNVTVSVGVNTYVPSHRDSLDNFILKADNALYTAKEAGRNRICKAHG